MRKIIWLPLLIALSAMISTASAQLKLVSFNSFGPNGDGTLRPGDFPFLTSDGNRYQRGMAFNPATGHLIIVNRNPIGAETINVIDALTGTNVSELDQSSRGTGGSASFTYNMIAITEDGAIYVGNLSTSGTDVQFNLYRWANESSPQALVYFGNPGNTAVGGSRWGDTLAARGAGMDTEILVATQNGTLAAILRPGNTDLTTFNGFTNAPLAAAVPSGGVGYGIAFGSNNTFYGKGASASGEPLYRMTYDTSLGTATPLKTNTPGQFPGTVGPMMILPSSNWLACIEMTPGTAPDILRLYDISNPAIPPVFLDRATIANWTNANSVYAGAVAFGFGTNLYALDSDNGIVAFSIESGTNNYGPYVFGQPQSLTVQLTSNSVFSVGVDGTAPLSYQWRFNGTDVAGATSNSYVIASSQVANIGSYSVVVTNAYGAATSSIATLYVLQNFGNVLVYDPFGYAVASNLDGQGGWVLNSGASFPVAAGSLNVPYLQPSLANHVVASANGTTRKPIGTYTQGVLYFSFAFKLDNITSATSSETVAAFAIGTSTSYSPKINILGLDGSLSAYTIGVYKGGGTNGGQIATNSLGAPLTFTTSDTVFIVGRYTFNAGANNDAVDMWINPDPSTFGHNPEPPPTVGPIINNYLGAAVADQSQIDRFVLRDASGYQGRHFDEVRVGFDWAGVTPPTQPTLSIALAGSNATLSWPTNISSGYSLEFIPKWGDPDGWQPVGTSVVVQGSNNTVTVPASATARFYRLKK